jgi:hypothetical protein
MDITVTVPDALVAAYRVAAGRRAARDPAHPLVPATRAGLELYVRNYLRDAAQFEVVADPALDDATIDAELAALAAL